jgi:hypothetical protein
MNACNKYDRMWLLIAVFPAISALFAFSKRSSVEWALLFSITSAHADDVVLDCGDVWANANLPHERSGGAFPCIEYRPSSATSILGPGSTYRLFYPAIWSRYPRPESTAFLETAAQGLTDSVQRLGALLPAYPVYVVISEHFATEFGVEEWDTLATAASTWVDADEPCPVVLHPLLFSKPSGDIKQIVAHEFFHCLQGAHFGDRMDENYDVYSWWREPQNISAVWCIREITQSTNSPEITRRTLRYSIKITKTSFFFNTWPIRVAWVMAALSALYATCRSAKHWIPKGWR